MKTDFWVPSDDWLGYRLLVDMPIWPSGTIIEGTEVAALSGGLKAVVCRVVDSDDYLLHLLPREIEPLTSASEFFLTIVPKEPKRTSKRAALPPERQRVKDNTEREERRRRQWA